MMQNEIKTSEMERPIPMPGHDVEASWGKCDVDDFRLTPAPPPVWTRNIDRRLKDECKE